MIFTPYSDETQKINMIQKFRNEDYALIRMTFTMIDKNNLDANGILREFHHLFKNRNKLSTSYTNYVYNWFCGFRCWIF